MFRLLELFHLRNGECLSQTELMNICLKCFVTFHSEVPTKHHMLLEAAILVLFVDNSIMENTQEEGVKRILLSNQVALLCYVCLKRDPACELAGN